MSVSRLFVVLFLLPFFLLGGITQQGIAEAESTNRIDTGEVILVAGATGRTGNLVVQQLKSLGYKKILGMTRSK